MKTIISAANGSSIENLTDVNGTLFFSTVLLNGLHDTDLWKSDGTADGTVPVTSICSGPCQSKMSSFTSVNGTLFFSAYESLWKSDGTEVGTVKIASNLSPADLTNVNGTLLFSATSAENGREPWKSDGTAAGTAIITDICPGACSSLQPPLTSSGDFHRTAPILFSGTSFQGSFGSSAPVPPLFTIANGKAFFPATDADHGLEPWTTDLTSPGTSMLQNTAVNTSSLITSVADLNGTALFSAYDGTSRALRKIGVNVEGSTIVKNIDSASQFQSIAGATDALFFSGHDAATGYELWKTDGTEAGTTIVKDINLGAASSYPSSVTSGNNKLFFAADDGVHGSELWTSDGTVGGTVLVKDIAPGANGSKPRSLINANGTLFLIVESATAAALWKSDGTEAGTVALKSFSAPLGSSCLGGRPVVSCWTAFTPTSLVNVNGTLFFPAPNGLNTELWKSDGTPEGTLPVSPGAAGLSPSNLTGVNGTLFYSATDGANGFALWKSDGTVAGTVALKTFTPGVPDPTSPAGIRSLLQWRPSYLVNVNGTLFFSVSNQLWKSDGTAEGTLKVKDVTADALTNVKGTLYFAGKDDNGTELWKSDGTSDGTIMVADINPGAEGSWPVPLALSRGKLLFTANDGVHGTELWALDIAPTTVSLASSRSPLVVDNSLALTATVTSSITGTPTGTVTFTDGDVPLGTASVNASGIATFTTAGLSVGTHILTATYSGDATFANSTSSGLSQVVLSAPPDYTLTANPASATIHGGESAMFTLIATADAYFDGTISFSCGQLPRGVTCSFTPMTLAPTNGHPAQATLVVATTSQRAALSTPASSVFGGRAAMLWVASFGAIGVLGCFVGGVRGRKRPSPLMVAANIATLALLFLIACGGGGSSQVKTNPNGTPVGTASIQVTATATAGSTGGNTSPHTLTINLNVQ